MKQCSKCGVNQKEKEFYKNKECKDGLQSNCKSCSIKYSLNWIKNHQERRNKNSKLWARKNRKKITQKAKEYRENNKEKYKEIAKRYRKNNINKYKARYYLNNAIRDGRIIKKNVCEICNKKFDKNKIRADHHKGYDKENWLIVKWVCIECDGKQLRKK